MKKKSLFKVRYGLIGEAYVVANCIQDVLTEYSEKEVTEITLKRYVLVITEEN